LVDQALLVGVTGRQYDPLNPNLPSGQEMVDVPALSARRPDVPEDTGAQGARGPAGVDVQTCREAETPQPPDRDAHVNWHA
jgi:hypothetical protein